MCLLVFMDKNRTAPEALLRNAAQNNPDGFGFAIHAGNKIITHKGMNFDAVYDQFIQTRKDYVGYALFHLRIATHGATNLDNCHPFYLGGDKRSVLAHNGMLPIEEENGMSDTRLFAEKILPTSGGVTVLNDERNIAELEKWAQGSKLVVMSVNKASRWDYVILNERLGHWGDAGSSDEGVWWSNSSYKGVYQRYFPSTYGYGSGWSVTSTTHKATDDYYVAPDEWQYQYSDDENLYWELDEMAGDLSQYYSESPDERKKLRRKLVHRFTAYCEPDKEMDGYHAMCYECGGFHTMSYLDLPPTHCSYCNACMNCQAALVDGNDCCEWGIAPITYPWHVVVGDDDCETDLSGDDDVPELRLFS